MNNPLVTENLRLVYTVAKQYHARGMASEDLAQEGMVGLIKAAERFEPERGLKFGTYAVYWIRAYILIAIQNDGLVRVNGKDSRAIFWKYGKTTKALEREGIEPTSEAIAERLGVSVGAVDAIGARLHPRDVSLDSPVAAKPEDNRTYADFFASDEPSPEDNAEADETSTANRQTIERALANLSVRERRIIRSRHMQDDPETLQEIGDCMGLSRERVRQIEARALGKLSRLIKRAA